MPIIKRVIKACRNNKESNIGRMEWFTIILAAFVIFYLVLPKMNQTPLDQAAKAIKDGAPFIDVRTSREFSQQSIPGSKNYPLARFAEDIAEANYNKDEPILVFCLSGTRSASALKQLKEMGFSQPMNIGSFARAQKAYQMSKE